MAKKKSVRSKSVQKVSTSKAQRSAKRLLWWALVAAVLAIAVFAWQISYLRTAHSTFENYYKFRGCVKLLQKADSYGICKLQNGQTIKIVKFNGRWYLDGDLPVCQFGICF